MRNLILEDYLDSKENIAELEQKFDGPIVSEQRNNYGYSFLEKLLRKSFTQNLQEINSTRPNQSFLRKIQFTIKNYRELIIKRLN